MDNLSPVIFLFLLFFVCAWLVLRNNKKPSQSNKHIINCSLAPFTPQGWKVKKHVFGEEYYEFNPAKIIFYQSPEQMTGRHIKGSDLLREIEGEENLNANVLDHLLANPELIPAAWEGKRIYFFGTIYLLPAGDLCVRYLLCNGEQWHWNFYLLTDGFYCDCFSVIDNP
jgi:hypothetical protein